SPEGSLPQSLFSSSNAVHRSGYIESLVRRDFERVAGLRRDELGNRLPEVQHLVLVARNQGVRISSATVDQVADNLLTVQQSASNFWPTASELINYRSFLSAPQQYVKITFQMRNCDVHPARDLTISTPQKDGSVETVTKRNAITIEQANCFLDLDEHNEIEDYVCHQCVVKYSGGSLTLKAPIEFKDCLFVFSIKSQPPTPSGVLLAQNLLSQNPQ